jgi:LacI family transcriptional regulator
LRIDTVAIISLAISMDDRSRNPPYLFLIASTREYWGRAIAYGVTNVLHALDEWELVINFGEDENLSDMLKRHVAKQVVAGVIGQFYPKHDALLQHLREHDIPVVSITSRAPPEGVAWIHNDDHRCGVMAAEHLIQQGHRHFAFLGIEGAAFSEARLAGFRSGIRAAGIRSGPGNASSCEHTFFGKGQLLSQWLDSLPSPIGIFACNDLRAKSLLTVALNGGKIVPDELAIVGVDNDDIYCNMGRLPISSVGPDWRRIGQRAVEVVSDRRRHGQGVPVVQEAIQPLGLSIRRSSEFIAVNDRLTARALQQIRQPESIYLTAAGLAQQLSVNRRTLERHFEKHLGYSIYTAILNERLRRVRLMLLKTSLSIGDIAQRCGFSKHSQLNAAFKKRFGHPPSQLRKKQAGM